MRTLIWASSICLAVGTAAAARADISVALVGPITGPNASGGEQLRNGAESAVADINAAGGVLGQKLVLRIEDDACDPRQAVSVANRLSTAGVVFVNDGYCSGATIPAAAVYAESNIPIVTPAATNPALTENAAQNHWQGVFRTVGRDDQQAKTAADYILKNYKGKRIFVIDDKSTYGKGVGDALRQNLTSAGQAFQYEQINAGEQDYNAVVARLKQANPDLVYFAGYAREAGLIVRQASAQGLKTQFMSDDALPSPDFWNITGPAGEGVLFTFGPDPETMPDAQEVIRKLKARKITPEGYTLYSYAAMQVFAQAAAQAKSLKFTDLTKAMHSMTFSTVVGPITYDAKGDKTAASYVVWRWNNGSYRPLAD